MRKHIAPEMLHRMYEAAQRYAAANSSDPFALARAKAHIKSGVAAPFTKDGEKAYYDADLAFETRKLPDGREYRAAIYINAVRP